MSTQNIWLLDLLREDTFKSAMMIMSALIGIYGLVQRHKADKLAMQLTELAIEQIENGPKIRPNLKLSICGAADQKISHFLLAAPVDDYKLLSFALRIQVKNEGQKTSQDVEMFIRSNKFILGGDALEYKQKGGDYKNASMHVNDKDPMRTFCCTFDSVHPDQTIDFNLQLSLTGATLFKRDTAVVCKDGINATVTWWGHFSHPIDIIVCQKDFPPVSKRVLLEVISNSKGTTEEVVNEYSLAIQKNLQEQKNTLSTISKLRDFFSQKNNTRHYLLIDVDKEKVKIIYNNKEEHIAIGEVPERALRFYSGVLLRDGFFFLT